MSKFGYVHSPQWTKYNLSIADAIYGEQWERAFQAHELVCNYLYNHPDINYTGNYFNILSLAEKERKMSMNRGA